MVIHYIGLIFRVFWIFVTLILVSRLIAQKLGVLVGFAAAVMAGIIILLPATALSDGIVALLTWGAFSLLTNIIATKSEPFRNAVYGKSTVLIEQGKVLEKNMQKSNLTIPDMMSMLRLKNAFKLSDVEFAVLETDGQISVMKKSELNPVSPQLEGIPIENESAPNVLIMNGTVITKTLLETGYSQGWLLGELAKQGAKDYTDVFLAQLDSKGNLYVDLYQDVIKPPEVKAKPLLLSSLKKFKADLEGYALATENVTARRLYNEQAIKLGGVIENIQFFLRG